MVAVLAVGWQYLKGKQGEQAVVTVDGILYGSYSLEQDRQIRIESDHGEHINVLQIAVNAAWMEEADCPDKICVASGKISKVGQTVVCAPAMISLRIVGGNGGELDAVTG